MIRTLTIVESVVEGKPEYAVSGNMPIDEAAAALVRIAYQAVPEQTGEQQIQEVSE